MSQVISHREAIKICLLLTACNGFCSDCESQDKHCVS